MARRLLRGEKRVPYSPDVPVIVICRDRLEPMTRLVAWLEAEGLRNIIFVDNDSTYPPLLAYFERTAYRVVRLGRNVGHTSPWLPEVQELIPPGAPYIVTDPDVVPCEGSHGAVREFFRLLNDYPGYVKVGFGLRIDDLPEHYCRRDEVIAWESSLIERAVERNVYRVPIDTTFALHRAGTPYTLVPSLRTAGRFVARHEPWYEDCDNVGAEVAYYLAHASSSATWRATAADGPPDRGDRDGATPG